MKYTEPGEYTLTYTAIDSCGNESTETREITVREPREYPYTMCTVGAEQVRALTNGESYQIYPDITWLKEPPIDGKRREFKIYGENFIADGETYTNPVGDGYIESDGVINGSLYYDIQNIVRGSNEIILYCSSDGMGSMSWDSLRFEVTREN